MEYYLVDKFNRGIYSKHKRTKNKASSSHTPSHTAEGLALEDNKFNAKRRKISNVFQGNQAGDVVTVDQTLIKAEGDNLFTHNNKVYKQHESGKDLDIGGFKIVNISDGTKDQHAASVKQVEEKLGRVYDEKTKVPTKSWNAKNMKVENVADGSRAADAVNMGQYYKSLRMANFKNTKKVNYSAYDAQNRKIKNVGSAEQDSDVVTLKQALTEKVGIPHHFVHNNNVYNLSSLKI